jgi:N-acetylmuramoyl-L-alanine amidase
MPAHLPKSSAFVALVLLSLLIGCVAAPQYTPSFRVDLKALDCAPLKGRRIVIDPGHGGRFPGAVGTQGLRESDINLAVALHLWGLLTQAGAVVRLTRSADVDLCPESEAVLGKDLEARSAFSNAHAAQVFISIHHNSNTYNRKKNNTQVYYKLTDPRPSQDLARAIADELAKGQALGEVLVLPGNYRVLRGAEAIAVLGEASFISHRKNEARLSLSNQLRREAEDYFLGILAYFQKGIPEVVTLEPRDVTVENAFPTISATIGGVGNYEALDQATIALFVDEQPVPCSFQNETRTISSTPQALLTNGLHTLRVEARNLKGNAAWSRPASFSVSLPPAKLTLSLAFSSLPADGESFTRGEVAVFDRNGNPVINGTNVSLGVSLGTLDHELVSLRGGRGSFYFTAPRAPGEARIEAHCQGVRSEAIVFCGALHEALLRLTVRDPEQKPIGAVQVLRGDTLLGVSDQNGLVFLRSDRSENLLVTLTRPGYESPGENILFETGAYRMDEISMVPREQGLLLDRRVVLDPELSPENDLSADTAEANLAVARHLHTLLTEAGAQAALTFTSPEAHPAPGERVLFAEKFPAELFLTIAHRTGSPGVFHYYLSATGKRLATRIAESLQQTLRIPAVGVGEGLDFTVIHTTAPSVVVNLGRSSVGKKGAVEGTRHEEAAKSIYLGLVEFLRAEPH